MKASASTRVHEIGHTEWSLWQKELAWIGLGRVEGMLTMWYISNQLDPGANHRHIAKENQ